MGDQQIVNLQNTEVNKEYFKSYGDLGVHRTMLRDTARLNAYWDAVFKDKTLFKDKIVLDVGAGTGILSVFCAKAGAKKVYSVEASKDIIPLLTEVIKDNGYEEIIQVTFGEIETIDLPEKVDIIISEWMGHFLLHEGMLDSIINARRFMHEDSIMIPDKATIYYALCDIPSIARDWSCVKNVNLCAITAEYRSVATLFPLIDVINEKDLKSEAKVFVTYDLYKVKQEDIDNQTKEAVLVTTEGGLVEGLCIWWEVDLFNGVTLSTAPSAPTTHWKQFFILFPSPIVVCPGTPIGTALTLNKTSKRLYKISLECLDPDEMVHDIPCHCFYKRCQLAKSFFTKLSRSTNA